MHGRNRQSQPIGMIAPNPYWKERGLNFLWIASASTYDLCSKKVATLSGISSSSVMGVQRVLNPNAAASSGVTFVDGLRPITSNTHMSILALCAPAATATRKIAFSQRYGSGSIEQINLMFGLNAAFSVLAGYVCGFYRNTAGAAGFADNATSALNGSDGLMHLWSTTLDNLVPRLWKDGAEIHDRQTNSAGTLVSTNQKTRIGNIADYTSDGIFANAGNYGMVAVFDGVVLGKTDQTRLSANPWELCSRWKRRLWFDEAAAVGGQFAKIAGNRFALAGPGGLAA